FRTALRWQTEGGTGSFVVTQGKAEIASTLLPLFRTQRFLLVSRVASLGRSAHAVSLHRLHQDHYRLAPAAQRQTEGRMYLARVLPTPLDGAHFLVAQRRHHPRQFRVAVYPVFTL